MRSGSESGSDSHFQVLRLEDEGEGDNTTNKKEALIERWGLKKKVEEWQEVRFKRALIRMLLKHGFTAKKAREIYDIAYIEKRL